VRRARARHIRRSTSHFALRSAVPTGEFVTTWEYLTTPLMIHNTAAILNNWGKQGWELVQVVPNADGGLVAYLKRPAGGGEQNAGLAHAAQAAKQ
jgi:hypothetical protein